MRASGRGEAKLCGRFDSVARAVVRPVYLLRLLGETMPGGLSTKNLVFTLVLQGFSRTTLVKPM